ncbi:hypothetical protein [Desulfovibrio aminophilus]|uniref:hypothetical protein n=1 Tax=Desulfovibrio aminophilus TaxID=81425 RepID=UPI003399EA73
MDLTLVQRENSILGQDFLTWLWYASEKRDGMFNSKTGQSFALHVEQKVSVQGGEGESLETATVSSPRGELAEAKTGLRTGKKVNKAQLRLEIDQDAWQVTLKADDFGISGLKTPKVDLRDQEDEDPDSKFLEKIYLLEKCVELLDSVFAEFLKLRLSVEWPKATKAVGAWMNQE